MRDKILYPTNNNFNMPLICKRHNFINKNFICYFVLVILLFSSFIFSQENKPWTKGEIHIEDSTHIHWTHYPNLFSPPTITSSSKGLYCGLLSFYCDLTDTVTVAIVNQTDSILYKEQVTSRIPPHFSLCFWLAGSEYDTKKLPENYYRPDENIQSKLVVYVKNRPKCSRNFSVKENQYFWLQSKK